MAKVTVEKNKYTVDPLYQWDLNQTLKIYGLSLSTVPEIHFTNNDMDRAIVKPATMASNGVITVSIPNSILQKPYKISAYVCVNENGTFKSLYTIEIPIKPRNKPADYTLEHDEEVYSFNKLEALIGPAFDRYTELNNLYAETVADVGKSAENAEKAHILSIQAQTSANTALWAMEEAKKCADATAVIDTVVFSNSEEAKDLPSPSFASYVNLSESMTEDDAINLAGILTMDVGDILTMTSGYYKTQIASVGGQLSGLMVRNIDVNNNIVYPWEWINPPMTPDVEYRTTERFNGKPVYRKLRVLQFNSSWNNWNCGVVRSPEKAMVIDVTGHDSTGRSFRNSKFSITASGRELGITYDGDNTDDLIVDIKYIKTGDE